MYISMLYISILHQVGAAVKSKIKGIKSRHEKKLDKLGQRQLKLYRNDSRYYVKNAAHNFSSYVLLNNEELALAYGLEQHIPVKLNKHTVKTEFEVFYQSLLKNISHIPQNGISLIKTKLGSTYEKYSNVYMPYEYRRIIENLSKNNSIVIMKQDKGRGVVIMDKHKYIEKCLEMLNTKQFSKISVDPTRGKDPKSSTKNQKQTYNPGIPSFVPYRFLSWEILRHR